MKAKYLIVLLFICGAFVLGRENGKASVDRNVYVLYRVPDGMHAGAEFRGVALNLYFTPHQAELIIGGLVSLDDLEQLGVLTNFVQSQISSPSPATPD